MTWSDDDRMVRTAQHAYAYNKDNPNILIAAYYNYGVTVINNGSSSKAALKKVKDYFTAALKLIDQSDKADIQALKGAVQQGLDIVSRM